MEHKINPDPKISPAPPGELPAPEIEGGDPPFERWIRMADALLRKGAVPFPKAVIPRDPKTLKH